MGEGSNENVWEGNTATREVNVPELDANGQSVPLVSKENEELLASVREEAKRREEADATHVGLIRAEIKKVGAPEGLGGGSDPSIKYFQEGNRLRDALAKTRAGSPEYNAAVVALKAHNLSREGGPSDPVRLAREAAEQNAATASKRGKSLQGRPVEQPPVRVVQPVQSTTLATT